MKKYFAKTFMSLCALGISSVAFAQEATETAVEGGMYQALKTKFIEGGADFMSLVARPCNACIGLLAVTEVISLDLTCITEPVKSLFF